MRGRSSSMFQWRLPVPVDGDDPYPSALYKTALVCLAESHVADAPVGQGLVVLGTVRRDRIGGTKRPHKCIVLRRRGARHGSMLMLLSVGGNQQSVSACGKIIEAAFVGIAEMNGVRDAVLGAPAAGMPGCLRLHLLRAREQIARQKEAAIALGVGCLQALRATD